MNRSQFLTTLNIRLGDTDNFTFTEAEKYEAIDESIKDPFVVEDVFIDTESFSTSNFRQALPSTITTVTDILYRESSDEFPDPLPQSLWQIRGGYIYWDKRARWTLTNGYGIFLEGWLKYETTDTIDDPGLQEYVLNLSIYNTLKLLTGKLTNRFLKNDVSMAELVAARNAAQTEVERYRRQAKRNWQSE